MSISGVGRHGHQWMPRRHGAQDGGTTSSFAEAVGASVPEASSRAGDDGGDGAKVDFTQMTRQGMFEWMSVTA